MTGWPVDRLVEHELKFLCTSHSHLSIHLSGQTGNPIPAFRHGAVQGRMSHIHFLKCSRNRSIYCSSFTGRYLLPSSDLCQIPFLPNSSSLISLPALCKPLVNAWWWNYFYYLQMVQFIPPGRAHHRASSLVRKCRLAPFAPSVLFCGSWCALSLTHMYLCTICITHTCTHTISNIMCLRYYIGLSFLEI